MKTKTELRSRLTGALAILGLLAGGLVFAGTASADYQQECDDAWLDAPAESVCVAKTIVGTRPPGSQTTNCDIQRISCSVSATNLAGGTVTWTISDDSSNRSSSDTETVDMCFAAQTNSEGATTGYTAALKAGCATGEITSENMDGSQLPY